MKVLGRQDHARECISCYAASRVHLRRNIVHTFTPEIRAYSYVKLDATEYKGAIKFTWQQITDLLIMGCVYLFIKQNVTDGHICSSGYLSEVLEISSREHVDRYGLILICLLCHRKLHQIIMFNFLE
jgi:hypothetical protein